jgi:LacI family transcriptional regulator
VTIREIATRAGVSASTVSRVLNDSTPVAAGKKNAVLAAVEALGYRPNVFARELARGRSQAIGVLAEGLSIPFFSLMVHGVTQGLRETDYYPLIAGGQQLSEAAQALDLLLSHRVDALIVIGGRIPHEDLRRVAERLPVAALGRKIEGLEHRCLHVENEEGGYKATRHLLELGHQRIVHITGFPWHEDSVDRRRGYLRALEEAGVCPDPALILEGNYQEASGLVAIERLLSAGTPFTAIFAGNDPMAYGAGLALFRRGLRVPRDVSLVGFDDTPSAAFTWPPLTTVRQSALRMGAAVADALVRELNGDGFDLPTFGTDLVFRESTAGPRIPAEVPARPSPPMSPGDGTGAPRAARFSV